MIDDIISDNQLIVIVDWNTRVGNIKKNNVVVIKQINPDSPEGHGRPKRPNQGRATEKQIYPYGPSHLMAHNQITS